jgi:hypothetical protein
VRSTMQTVGWERSRSRSTLIGCARHSGTNGTRSWRTPTSCKSVSTGSTNTASSCLHRRVSRLCRRSKNFAECAQSSKRSTLILQPSARPPRPVVPVDPEQPECPRRQAGSRPSRRPDQRPHRGHRSAVRRGVGPDVLRRFEWTLMHHSRPPDLLHQGESCALPFTSSPPTFTQIGARGHAYYWL